MSHLFQPPLPLRVLTEAGEPRLLQWQGRHHPVRRIVRTWRVDVGWWEAPVGRDCYQLLTETGLLVEIFYDLHAEQWFLLRLYD